MFQIRKVDAITKARAEVVMADPFFGTLLLRMRFVEDPNCDTAWCNGVTIGYNPKFIKTLTAEELKGLLVHEIMHPAMLHHIRRARRHPKRWNMAADYAINQLIHKRYALPKGALIDPQFKDKSTEEIYKLLPEGCEGDYPGTDPGRCGEVRDNPNDGQSQDAADKQAESEWKQNLAAAAHNARMRGNMPSELEKLVESALTPVVDWKNVLRRFATERAREDNSWNRPQRRFVAQGLYLPGKLSEHTGVIAVFRDTSGSIYCDPESLEQFNGEIFSIALDVKPSKLIIIDVDAAVQQVFEIDVGEEIPAGVNKAKGGGGTSFIPPFQYLIENGIEPKCVIYLTDGYGDFPREEDVEWPTMWVMTTDVEPPFGECVRIR
jgi:predicted metal-dependent peptidase